MTDHSILQELPFQGEEQLDLPALAVQSDISAPPEYSTALYRLYLGRQERTEILLEGQPVALGEGCLLTLSPGEIVEFQSGTRMQSIAFHHNFFCVRVMRDEVFCDGVVFNRLSGLPIVEFPREELPFIENKFNEIDAIVEAKSPFAHDRVLNVLRSLLLHAADFKIQANMHVEDLENKQVQLSPLVLEFQNLVEETFTEHKSASYYSDKLKVSTVTLNRRIKQELGRSVMQVVNERLAIEARVALRSGKKSVKEVAFDLGFNDPLYFSRFFRKQFGNPPSQYFVAHQEALE